MDWMDPSNRVSLSQACSEFDVQMRELGARLKSTKPVDRRQLEHNRELAAETRAVKMVQTSSKPAPTSPYYPQALQAAQEAQAKYGNDSIQARMAWEDLEEIASADTSNAYGPRLDEECLVESAMEACIALEELNRVLNLEKTHNDAGLNS